MTSANSDQTPACHNSRNRAFLTLSATLADITAARRMCQSCPLLKACAKDALHAGDSLDGGWTRPANDVMQAGIKCRGDDRTARALARVAEVDVPEYRNGTRRNAAADECRACGRPMTVWTRTPEEIPEGHVMHYAKSFCVNCRPAHRAHLKAERAEGQRDAFGALRKPIDRNRHHPNGRPPVEEVAPVEEEVAITRRRRTGRPLATPITRPRTSPAAERVRRDALQFAIAMWPRGRARPSHCMDCQRPLRASHMPADGVHAKYAGKGLCNACHSAHSRALKAA